MGKWFTFTVAVWRVVILAFFGPLLVAMMSLVTLPLDAISDRRLTKDAWAGLIDNIQEALRDCFLAFRRKD